ncbi:lysophospholipid acyltransferase family protein [Thermodesulfobacteriota bacterium]
MINNYKDNRNKFSFRYWVLRTILQLMAYIPLWLGHVLGNFLGLIALQLPISRKAVSIENIQNSLGTSMTRAEVLKLNRMIYLHFGRMVFEIPHLLRMNKDNIKKYFAVEGEENLKMAFKNGRGVLALTGHIGNWELLAVALHVLYGPIAAVARPSRNPALNRLINDLRSRLGMELIPKQHGMRKIITALNKNRLVGILLDQNVDWYEGEFVPFLNRTACANKGLALLALKTGTPVVPIFSIKQPDGKYKIHIDKPVELIRTNDKTIDVEKNTALFTKIIDSQVRKHPEQWFWFHRRWKTKNYCPLDR